MVFCSEGHNLQFALLLLLLPSSTHDCLAACYLWNSLSWLDKIGIPTRKFIFCVLQSWGTRTLSVMAILSYLKLIETNKILLTVPLNDILCIIWLRKTGWWLVGGICFWSLWGVFDSRRKTDLGNMSWPFTLYTRAILLLQTNTLVWKCLVN